MPITSTKPKIIGLVLLSGGRISFFLQGTYNALVGKASRPLINPVLSQTQGRAAITVKLSSVQPHVQPKQADQNIVRSVLLISKYAITHEGEKFFTSKPEMKSPLGHGMLITASVWHSLRPSR